MQTHKDPKLMKEREDEYLGRAIEIETHISSKTGKPTDSKFLRIYYAWDAPSGKIVIGDTRHLTNYSTRSMK